MRVAAVEVMRTWIRVVILESLPCFIEWAGTSDSGSREWWTVKMEALN